MIDATGIPLGRLASRIAALLRGKHKPNFTPHVDCGDNVIVLNAGNVKLSGNKWEAKKYIWYTGYPGGQKSLSALDMSKRNSLKILENAVKGMLPKNKLGRNLFKNLYLYEGNEHRHEAQKPKVLNFNELY